jgi:hypothetical protein
MTSLAWPMIADARASLRHEPEVAVGDQWAWRANARPAWRSRSAVTMVP